MPDFGIFRGFNEKLFGDKLYAGQLPTQLGLIGSEDASGFDADAQAFFNRVDTAGGTLSATEKTAVNQLVLDMKADDIWSSMKAIYPMVGASAAACAQNLKSSSFTGTFNGGWTFASTGVTPNGTNAYMDTGYIESLNVSLNNVHLSFYSRTNIDELAFDIGADDGPNQTGIVARYNDNTFYRVQGLDGGFTTTANSRAFYLGNRISSTETRNLRNATRYVRSNSSIGAVTTYPYYLGAINDRSSAGNFSNKEYAFASMGEGLTDTEASDFYTAVQAFNTTLSREV